MDGGDWRSELQSHTRQMIVNEITDSLIRFVPFNGYEHVQDLKRISVRFEEKVYTTATSKSEYLEKISVKLQMMGKNNPLPNIMQSNSSNNGPNSPDPDFTANTEHGNGGDWQEEVYLKIQCMKDAYLQDLNEIYRRFSTKEESLLQQPHSQEKDRRLLEKIRSFKSMLGRFISFLQASKSNVELGYKDKLDSYENHIIEIIKCCRPRVPHKPMPSLQQGQARPPYHMHYMLQSQQPQSQITQVQHLGYQMNGQIHNPSLMVKHEVKQEPGTLGNPSLGVKNEVKQEAGTPKNPSLRVKNEVKKEPGSP